MRLRQVVLVARDLDRVVDDLCAVLGVQVCFRDPNVGIFGLKNAVIPLGDTFLEVVSPVRADAAAARYLDRRGGDGGYMVIIQCDDLEADRKRVAELGIRVAWCIDLPEISATHLHPRDVGGAILSLDASRPPASWLWAGPDWETAVQTEVTKAIAGVEIQGVRHAVLAEKWSRVLDRPVRRNSTGDLRLDLDQGLIDFREASDDRSEGLSAMVVTVTDHGRLLAEAESRNLCVDDGEVVICGTRIRPA